MSGFVGEHFAGEVVLARDFKRVGVLPLRWMERECQDGFTGRHWVAGKRQEEDLVTRIKRIDRSAENGDVVLDVHGDDCSLKQFGWAIAAADQNVGLSAVAKSF